MRTVFVNPKKRRRRKKKSTKRRRTRRNASMSNPRRRRSPRRRTTRRRPTRRRTTYRRRRRNAGVTSFVEQNPLILSNPRRRRRRRRNPRLNFRNLFKKTLTHMGGGALGYGANQFGLSYIENDWARRAAQVLTGVAGAYFMKGELGASFAGATYYPLMADLAMYSGLVAVPTEADLLELSADLEASLLEADLLEDDELYIEDMNDAMGAEEEMVAW